MIILYGFGRVPRQVMGLTRDLRVRWALEEIGLAYRVHGLDHTGGELDSPAYAKISCFRQVPVIDDEGFIVAESAAILLYLAEKAGKLIPADFEGRTRVVQWCFAALATVELPLTQILSIDMSGGDTHGRRPEMVRYAQRVLGNVERRLEGCEWIACKDFTVADILLATVLREIRKTELLDSYPHVRAFYERALGRPAWKRALAMHAELLGVQVEEIA